jgi:hypothetical protein
MTAEPPRASESLTHVALLERVDTLLRQARNGHRDVSLSALEDVYTTGCAAVLELEAESIRLGRRSLTALETAGNGGAADHPDLADLAESSRTVDQTLTQLRSDLRHVRTAIEWMQEQGAGERAR